MKVRYTFTYLSEERIGCVEYNVSGERKMFNNNSYRINKIINSSSEDIYLGATRFDIQMKNKNGEYVFIQSIS